MSRVSRDAFSMVELIFVIVVLGIVASISSETIAQIYKNTIPQKAQNVAALKSELAAEQIANRLSYAIPWSVVFKNTNNTAMTQLADAPENDETVKVIEWVGVDGDSFEATATPGWSGFCDVNSPTATRALCPTPGSNLNITDRIISKLGGAGIADAIVLFKTTNCIDGVQYAPQRIGLDSQNQNTSCAFSAAGSSGTNLVMPDIPKLTADMYALAWSAYAIEPFNDRDINGDGVDDVFDLRLRYGYQPWQGENFTNASSQVIATNVSVFKFAQNPLSKNDIRFKICIKQPIGRAADEFVSMCKEKVVLR